MVTLWRGHDLASDDHYAQIVGTALGSVTDDEIRVLVRRNASNRDHYAFIVDQAEDYQIYKFVSLNFTSLAVLNNQPLISAGAVIKIEADGSNLTGFTDTTERLSTTDTDLTGNVRTGFGLRQNVVRADNFEAGDLFPGLFVSVDDDPASPDVNDWVNNAVDVN